jgi:hypothetical protein
MSLNEKYKSGFIAQVDASRKGEAVYIPVGLERVGQVFNIMQSRYILIAGATGSGKTSFADETFILDPYTFVKNTDKGIHWEALYFSLERKQMFKHAKWISWMIYRDHGLLVGPDELMGWGEAPVNSAGYKLIRSYDKEMSELLEHVHIYDGKIKPEVIERNIKARALALGVFFYSDDNYVYTQDNPVYVKSFEVDGQMEQTKTGPRVYIEMEYKDTKFKLYQDDHQYFPHNPLTFLFIVIDGINLLGDKKQIDEISVMCADARDHYGFSPVIVTQQNRSMGDITRMKAHGEDLSPQIEDIYKSSQMGFDADLIIGMFDMYRYKAWDKEGKHEGYYLKPDSHSINTYSMLSPTGQSRIRSIHILKNSFGGDGNKFCLKFLGECNHFETLPFPDDAKIDQVYADIKQGK